MPQASYYSHFFENGHNGNFRVGIKIIDGADDVFSLRRKELFWQYRLQTFSPKGLNERAADVELDIFACGTALVLPLHLMVSGGCAGVRFVVAP